MNNIKNNEQETYEIINGRVVDDSPFVIQQVVAYLKETIKTKLILVGYKEYENNKEVSMVAHNFSDIFSHAGLDVGFAGACTLPELSLFAERLGACACFIDLDATYFLDNLGGYLHGSFPIRRFVRERKGMISRVDVQKEYMRHLRKDTAVDRLSGISIAIGGQIDPKEVSLLNQIISLKGLWRVRSDSEVSLKTIGDSVIRLKADLGLKINSAGTKVEFVNNLGEEVKIEEIAALIARYLKEQGSLTTASRKWNVSRFFDRVAEKAGLRIEKDADFIVGEEIIYKKHLGVGDALWLGLIVAEIIAVSERPLSELIKEMESVVGKREYRLLSLQKNEVERLLRKLVGRNYSIAEKGELEIDGDLIAWEKIQDNLYSLYIDGSSSRLRSVQEILF